MQDNTVVFHHCSNAVDWWESGKSILDPFWSLLAPSTGPAIKTGAIRGVELDLHGNYRGIGRAGEIFIEDRGRKNVGIGNRLRIPFCKLAVGYGKYMAQCINLGEGEIGWRSKTITSSFER